MEQLIDKISTNSILILVMVALEMICVPLFLHFYWPNRTWKSFTMKTISSIVFILCGVFSAQLCYVLNTEFFHGAGFNLFRFTGGMLDYPRYIILGLIFGMLGDVVLHKLKGTNLSFIIGMLLFLAGHIFYIMAFDVAKGDFVYDKAETVGKIIIGIGVAFVIAILVTSIVTKKIKGREAVLAAAAIYGVILFTMVSKAVSAAMTFVEYSEPGVSSPWGNLFYATTSHDPRPEWMINGQKLLGGCESWQVASVVIVVGAVLFITSDLLLGFMIAREKGFGKAPKRSLRIINIYTYYVAQIVLALSILVIPLGFEWVEDIYPMLGFYS